MADDWTSAIGRKVRMRAWYRDRRAKAPCWICGQPIDYSLKPSSCGEAWEPDHKLPRSRFPELVLDLSNIYPSHRSCNRSRQDRAHVDVLGNVSGSWRRGGESES
jgi:5-methylcytosine-specific restriction endonuclease McrA